MSRRLVSVAAALALGVGLLAGCTATTELSVDASAAMQTAVVSVADAAAAGDPTGAVVQLDVLQQHLDAALADGSVSAERAARIQAAIDAVRADLQPEPAVEPTPEVTTDPPVTDDGDDNGDGGDNSGPGNNNGNGNGKGKGDD